MNLLTLLTLIDDVMYFPILIIIMASAGIYFSLRTRGVQIRLFFESISLLFEHSDDKNSVSSLQAMLVSTASRVGTGKHHRSIYSNLSWRSGGLFLDVAYVHYRSIFSIH